MVFYYRFILFDCPIRINRFLFIVQIDVNHYYNFLIKSFTIIVLFFVKHMFYFL